MKQGRAVRGLAYWDVSTALTINLKIKDQAMASLSDPDKQTFIGDIITALKGNKDLLIAGNPTVPGSGWDPTQRVAALVAGEAAVTDQETVIAGLERNYELASASVGSVEGALGKDHPLSEDLHQLRGSYSQAPVEPEEKPKP